MNPLAWVAVMGLLFGSLGGSWLVGYRAGTANADEKVAKMNAVVQAEVADQARRMDKLHVEIEVLRKRPERVRTIVKEVLVHADAACESLPADWRRLWNAAGREDSAAAGPAVGDGGGMPVAGNAGRGEGNP
jgi:hypothetical protein